jgi:hypothetical protein
MSCKDAMAYQCSDTPWIYFTQLYMRMVHLDLGQIIVKVMYKFLAVEVLVCRLINQHRGQVLQEKYILQVTSAHLTILEMMT